MDDEDLKRIREERLRQLKQQQGGGNGGASAEEQRQQQQQQQQEARQNLLNQILEPDAADRLARIRLVKQERATLVEDRLLVLAQSGQLRGKVTEDQLKDLLQKLSAAEDAQRGSSSSAGKITTVRRGKSAFDEDDDLDLDI